MALSDDQRAMLRLLAQREQGYDDLASLMGLSVDEVRAKVKDALDALEEGEEAPLLPAEPKPPEPVQAEEPPAVEKAPEPEAPAAPAPSKPVATPKPASPPKRPSSSPPRLSMPSGRGPRAAIAAGAAVVVLVIVLLAVNGGDSGSGTDSTTTASTAASEEATTEGQAASVANNEDVTQATLTAVDGSDASGVAVFGRVKNKLALQVEAEGLAPTAKGESYAIWMADSPQKMLPLASTEVGAAGTIEAQFEVPTEVLAYLAGETFDQIDVTLTSNAKLKASLDKATREKKAPSYTGTAVLQGTITGPIVGAAKKSKK